jgi:hypothetical protein
MPRRTGGPLLCLSRSTTTATCFLSLLLFLFCRTSAPSCGTRFPDVAAAVRAPRVVCSGCRLLGGRCLRRGGWAGRWCCAGASVEKERVCPTLSALPVMRRLFSKTTGFLSEYCSNHVWIVPAHVEQVQCILTCLRYCGLPVNRPQRLQLGPWSRASASFRYRSTLLLRLLARWSVHLRLYFLTAGAFG